MLMIGDGQWEIAVYALRYVLGRKTFAPLTFIEWITPQVSRLRPSTCAIMARDIREWASMVGRTETLRSHYLETDIAQWDPLLDRLDERAGKAGTWP